MFIKTFFIITKHQMIFLSIFPLTHVQLIFKPTSNIDIRNRITWFMSFKKTLNRHFVLMIIEDAIEGKKSYHLLTPLLYTNTSFLTFTVRIQFSLWSI